MYNTYSFSDVSGSIGHINYGIHELRGGGSGELTITKAEDKTTHQRAADGVVQVTKISTNNGQLTITVQQSSELHRWLLGLYNYLDLAETSQWAMTTAYIRSASDGSTHTFYGMSPQKVPDISFQSDGQMVSWVFLVADIRSLPIGG